MTKRIDITKSKFKELPFLNEKDYEVIFNKGWSLSSVYNFSELRDVFLALKDWSKRKVELNDFFSYCENINLPYVKTKWNKRRLLEHLNALKNFSLLDSNYRIIKTVFNNSNLGSPISEGDLSVFRSIYFHYFRFKEMFFWFFKPFNNQIDFDLILNLEEQAIIKNSSPLFCFSNESRFTDSFIYDLKDESIVYYINRANEDLMRFWDVFTKWGTTLKVIEKFNLNNLEIKTINNKQITCVYVINDKQITISLIEFIKQHFSENYIYLPQLVFMLVINFRLSIEETQSYIIEQFKIHKELLSFERTSEIFIKKMEIKKGERILFPKYNDSYVSHLIMRK